MKQITEELLVWLYANGWNKYVHWTKRKRKKKHENL